MTTKTLLTTLAALTVATGLFAQDATKTTFSEDVRQALKGAAEKVQASLATSKISANDKTSVFFIEGDSGDYVRSLVRDAVLASGRSFVVPDEKEDDLLKKIYAEMDFGDRKVGELDQKTVARINDGQLKATEVLIYGTVWTVVDNDRYALVEISLGAYSVKTKEFLWSGAFDCRYYEPGKTPEIGIVDLPTEVRETLKQRISTAITQSINDQPKLKAIKTAAILPLVGDESAKNIETNAPLFTGKAPTKDGGETIVLDGYVTHIVVDGVSRTSVTPKNADAQTRAEVRRLLRDKPQVADGMLFGAVRALDVIYDGSAFRKTKYQVVADVQVSIEEAATQNVLWSDTIQASVPYEVELSWWEWIILDYPDIDRASFYVGLAGRILIVLIILAILGKISRASARVR